MKIMIVKRVICKDNIDSISGILKGLTLGKVYDVLDTNTIGYFIKDDLDRAGWYCRDKFLEKEEVREVSLDLLFGQNKPIDVFMIDDTRAFSTPKKWEAGKVVNRYMSDDVREVVINDFPSLAHFDILTINSIIMICKVVQNADFTQGEIVNYWRVSYSNSNGIIMAGATCDIVDLDIKIRDIKLRRLTSEKFID